MYMIEVSDKKMSNLSELIRKMLQYGGKAMDCIEDMKSEERKSNSRHTMENGRHMMDEDYDDYDDDYEYGRERERRGRYSRR